MQESSHHYAASGTVDAYRRYEQGKEQAGYRPDIVDSNRERRQEELLPGVQKGSDNCPKPQEERLKQHDARQRGRKRLCSCVVAGYQQVIDEGWREQFSDQQGGGECHQQQVKDEAAQTPRCLASLLFIIRGKYGDEGMRQCAARD